jgi:hypothetical protein
MGWAKTSVETFSEDEIIHKVGMRNDTRMIDIKIWSKTRPIFLHKRGLIKGSLICVFE